MKTKTTKLHPLYAAVRERDYKSLSCAEVAKLVRERLKKEFPGVKFSVRSDTYSGGASIRVRWTDGPAGHQVTPVLRQYAGAGFDGSIDLKYYRTHFLHADGTVSLAHDGGTQGSMGYHPEKIGDPMDGSAIEVRMGADYVFADRSYSEEMMRELGRRVWQKYATDHDGPEPQRVEKCFGDSVYYNWDRDPRMYAKDEWFSTLIHREAEVETETEEED